MEENWQKGRMVFVLGLVLNLTYHRYDFNINAKKFNPKPKCLRQLFFFATIAMHWMWLVMRKVRKVTFYGWHTHKRSSSWILASCWQTKYVSFLHSKRFSCKCCPWILQIIYDQERRKKMNDKLWSISRRHQKPTYNCSNWYDNIPLIFIRLLRADDVSGDCRCHRVHMNQVSVAWMY